MGGLVDCSLHGEAFTFYVQDAVSSSGGDTLSTALLCSPLPMVSALVFEEGEWWDGGWDGWWGIYVRVPYLQ